ncbi:hypothetical protein EWX79_13805 [Enterococcus faecalis]|nr:hypothetical protein [Enterococcus faecalis]
MLSNGKIEKKRVELLNLFELANEEPFKVQKIIERKVSGPYTRSSTSHFSEENIMNATNYHIQIYYSDFLYKIWNYANQVEKQGEY